MENSELITKALQYIKTATVNSEISIEDVANHAGFSTDYFNRIFLAHTGFNVMEYVRFSRMKKAAHLLRCTDKDILNIALDCGYEAHESFARTFKKQYGVSPTEYRKQTEKTEPLYGDFHSDTVGARLLHEFIGFKLANTDEVIDHMLETNALKYIDVAILCQVNGGAALYNGKDFRDGFVWFFELNGKFMGEIVCEKYDKISEYLKIFSDDRFDMYFHTTDDDKTVKEKLLKYEICFKDIERRMELYYADEPYLITPPLSYTMRELKYEDFDAILSFANKKKSSDFDRFVENLKRELYQRDEIGCAEHSVFVFGIFYEKELVGISLGCLQQVHGFVINNSISTSLLEKHKNEDILEYAFKFVTNAALQKGALPTDETYISENKTEEIDPVNLGYKIAAYSCRII
ncbi:MAG: helix-turn-helix transcriptional regulator [Clostridia bacterium]|nr:helix-turn-helix transcriptional regulator [Clostridia bacterium]